MTVLAVLTVSAVLEAPCPPFACPTKHTGHRGNRDGFGGFGGCGGLVVTATPT